jgi:hypothetical protein
MRYSRAQCAAEIGVWKVVPLAASPISVQSSVLPAGPDNAQNNCTGDPGAADPDGAQLGAVVPVQVYRLRLGRAAYGLNLWRGRARAADSLTPWKKT